MTQDLLRWKLIGPLDTISQSLETTLKEVGFSILHRFENRNSSNAPSGQNCSSVVAWVCRTYPDGQSAVSALAANRFVGVRCNILARRLPERVVQTLFLVQWDPDFQDQASRIIHELRSRLTQIKIP